MLPVERSSMMKTSSPRWRYASARCDPMNPAPPVMRTRKPAPLDASVEADDIRDQTFFGVRRMREGAPALRECVSQRGIGEQPPQPGRESGVVIRGGGDAALADFVPVAAPLDDLAEDVDHA